MYIITFILVVMIIFLIDLILCLVINRKIIKRCQEVLKRSRKGQQVDFYDSMLVKRGVCYKVKTKEFEEVYTLSDYAIKECFNWWNKD